MGGEAASHYEREHDILGGVRFTGVASSMPTSLLQPPGSCRSECRCADWLPVCLFVSCPCLSSFLASGPLASVDVNN